MRKLTEKSALLEDGDASQRLLSQIEDTWLSMSNERNLKSIYATIAGYIFGTIGSLVAFPLGQKFGDTISNEESSFLGYFFAVTALVSLASLGSVTASKKFKSILASNPPQEKKETTIIHYARYSNSFISITLAMISAIQFAYVTGKYLGNGDIGAIIISIIAFLMYTLFNKDAVDTVFKYIYQSSSACINNSLKETQNFIRMTFSKAILFYTNASPSIIEKQFDCVFNGTGGNKLDALLNIDIRNISLESGKRVSPYIEKIISITGFVLGALVGYVYYDISMDAMTWFFNFVEIDNESSKDFSKFIAITACIANGALGAINLKFRFNQIISKFLDPNFRAIPYFTNRNVRKAIIILGAIFGASAAIPVTYLLYDYIANEIQGSALLYLMLIPTFLAPTAIRSRSFEQMLNDFVDFIRSFRSPTIDDKRDHIIMSLKGISDVMVQPSSASLFKEKREVNEHGQSLPFKFLSNQG